MRSSLLSNRRNFLKTVATASAAVALTPKVLAEDQVPRRNIKLGIDNFAVRALKWNALELIDYAVKLKTDSLFITDFNKETFASFEPSYLAEIKKKADDNNLQLHVGSWSICPTSKKFRKDWGTADEHLALGIRVAKALGSPVFRCILGMGDDRSTEGGIEARIEDTVKVLKAARSRAVDAGVKIAVENHGGDMQAWELVTLIEAAGKDFVGANIDSGNAAWTFEDPLENLEILGPYVATSSLRDSMIWETENGAAVQWTAMGEGCVDLKKYFDRFAVLCPGVPVHIETISGFPRELALYKKEFWNVWPKARAKDLAKFIALAKKGHSIPPSKSANDPEFQKGEVERSIKYCKDVLGLGPCDC